jgi:hypothetical protein
MADKNDVNFYGKIAKFPKNTKASSAYNFLENIKVSKKQLWYILIEKDDNGLQVIKYNNKLGFNLYDFINELKKYYAQDEEISPYIENLKIDGEDKFSIIKDVPDVTIGGKKLITILANDLIKLLYK